MTAQGRIERTPEAQAAVARGAAAMAIMTAIEQAMDVWARTPGLEGFMGEVLCAKLESIGRGMPDSGMWSNLREDAAFWADTATPAELEAYAAAALARIERTTFAERARKRLFQALWRSFTDEERANFIKGITNRAGGP